MKNIYFLLYFPILCGIVLVSHLIFRFLIIISLWPNFYKVSWIAGIPKNIYPKWESQMKTKTIYLKINFQKLFLDFFQFNDKQKQREGKER